MGTVTTVGRTLDRNLSSVDEILQNGNNLFQGAERGLRPELQLARSESRDGTGGHRCLHRGPLAGPPGRDLPADRGQPLQRVCPPRCLATLNQCGNPSSGFFDPLLNDIPTILNTLSGGSSAATAQSLLQQGLTQIANAEQGSEAAPSTPAAPTPGQKSPASDLRRRRPRPCRARRRRPRPPAASSASSSVAPGARARVRVRVRTRRAVLELGARRPAFEPGLQCGEANPRRRWPWPRRRPPRPTPIRR